MNRKDIKSEIITQLKKKVPQLKKCSEKNEKRDRQEGTERNC
jgi:hypothetical protein